MRHLLSLGTFVCLVSCSQTTAPTDAPFTPSCTVPAASEDAIAPAGPHPAQPAVGNQPATPAGWIQVGGRDLTPAGRLLPVGGYPLSLRVLPAPYQRYLLVSSAGVGDNYLSVVDTAAAPERAVVSRITYKYRGTERDPALFFGLAVAQQGGVRVFAAGGGYNLAPAGDDDPAVQAHVVEVYGLTGDQPQLTQKTQVPLPRGPAGLRYPAGLALSSDEKTLYVVGQADGSLTLLGAAPGPDLGKVLGSVEGLGVYPYDVIIDETARRAYVSLFGGELLSQRPLQLREGLVAVDLSDPARPRKISDSTLDLLMTTGKASAQLLRAGRGLLVAAADGDRLTRLDLDALLMPMAARPAPTIDLTADRGGLRGASPTGMAADAARDRLYLASARDNAVRVYKLSDLSPIGAFPAAAYPTAIAVLGDGSLAVTSARGSNYYPTAALPDDHNPAIGAVQIIPADEDPVRGEAIVQRNNTRPQHYAMTPSCPPGDARFPLPLRSGDKGPIEHVFLLVRENKTYDAVLGDMPGTRGRPDLLLFRPEATPNLHALAARFANLDNFYANADQSIQGHEWTTAAFASDFTELAWQTTWGRNSRAQFTFGGSMLYDYTTQGGSGSLFMALDHAGISYHNYGEIVNSQNAKVGIDTNFPGAIFNLDVPDVTKVDYILARLADPAVTPERFHYIGLPNDHTFGTRPGKPTPDAMVADNDEATGRLIEGLSRSPLWSKSIVFLIEDDPSDGADHVESHRSPCLVMSPWVRRAHISHVNYDDPALWRTIEMLLGLPPTNLLTATAAPMYDLFIGAGEAPDLMPYTALPRQVPQALNAQNAVMAAESQAIDFSRPDTASLIRILWRAQRGVEPPFGAPRPRSPFDADDDD